MTQITALASATLLPARLSFQPRHGGVVAWGGRKPTQRAIHASNAPRENGMNSAHSLSDTIMDLSRFISGGIKPKGIFNDLAQSIGKEIYVDVQGWHIYLKDIHMDTDTTMDQALASQLGPLAQPSQELTECMLKGILLDMGEGKLSVPLYDAIPMKCIQNLAKIITAYNKH